MPDALTWTGSPTEGWESQVRGPYGGGAPSPYTIRMSNEGLFLLWNEDVLDGQYESLRKATDRAEELHDRVLRAACTTKESPHA